MQRIIPEFVTSILDESINCANHMRHFEQNTSNLQQMYIPLHTCYMSHVWMIYNAYNFKKIHQVFVKFVEKLEFVACVSAESIRGLKHMYMSTEDSKKSCSWHALGKLMFLLHRCLQGSVQYVNFNKNHPIKRPISELSFKHLALSLPCPRLLNMLNGCEAQPGPKLAPNRCALLHP